MKNINKSKASLKDYFKSKSLNKVNFKDPIKILKKKRLILPVLIMRTNMTL